MPIKSLLGELPEWLPQDPGWQQFSVVLVAAERDSETLAVDGSLTLHVTECNWKLLLRAGSVWPHLSTGYPPMYIMLNIKFCFCPELPVHISDAAWS